MDSTKLLNFKSFGVPLLHITKRKQCTGLQEEVSPGVKN